MITEEVRGPVGETGSGARHLKRVLLAFDGSPGSQAALEQAIAIAVDNRALLTIAAVVVEPKMCTGFGPAVVPYTRESMRRDIEREMQRHLAAARDEVPATVSVTTRLLHGNPAKALAALADAGDYDLVVVGPRRCGRLRRLLGGSVTHSLLSRVNTSVLAVRAPDDSAEATDGRSVALGADALLRQASRRP
jgi:nucleotide-binding universal stress UspA family protein